MYVVCSMYGIVLHYRQPTRSGLKRYYGGTTQWLKNELQAQHEQQPQVRPVALPPPRALRTSLRTRVQRLSQPRQYRSPTHLHILKTSIRNPDICHRNLFNLLAVTSGRSGVGGECVNRRANCTQTRDGAPKPCQYLKNHTAAVLGFRCFKAGRLEGKKRCQLCSRCQHRQVVGLTRLYEH
jgi:hypothetical protein